jgi:hypothetical protein
MVGQVQIQDAELVHTTVELTEATLHILTQEVLLGTEVILGATVIHTVTQHLHTQPTVTQDQIAAGILGPGNKLNNALLREVS